jgi:hypothetical protein
MESLFFDADDLEFAEDQQKTDKILYANRTFSVWIALNPAISVRLLRVEMPRFAS